MLANPPSNSSLLQRLIAPHPALTVPEDRRRAQLLAVLQLTMIPFSVVILVVWSRLEPTNHDLIPPVALLSLASMISVYGLSRTRYYRWGVALMVGLLFAVINIIVFGVEHENADSIISAIDFLGVAVLLASVLLSLQATLMVALVAVFEVTLLPLLLPQVLPIALFGRVTFILLISALVMVVATLRRRDLEQIERQSRDLAETESRYRQMFEKNRAVKLLIDPTSGQIMDANPAACEYYGYPYERIKTLNISDINTLSDAQIREEMQRALSEKRVYFLFQHRLASGEIRDVEVHSGPIEVSGRGVLFSIIHDITERKQAEAALQRQMREAALLDQARTALSGDMELSDLMRTVVEGVAETFGYTLVSLYLLEDDKLRLQHQVGYHTVIAEVPITEGVSGRVVRTGQPALVQDVQAEPSFLGAMEGITSEVCVPLFDRERVVGTFNVESTNQVKLTEADLRLIVALSEHIGVAIQRARLYSALRESEQRFRSTFEQAAVGIAQTSMEGKWLRVNERLCEMLGYTRDELLAQTWQAITHPDDLYNDLALERQLVAGEINTFSLEKRYIRKDGVLTWANITVSLVHTPAGEPDYHIVVIEDINERKRAEEALRESEHLFRSVFEQAAVGIAFCGVDGRYERVNQKMCDIVGYTPAELCQRTFQEITHPEDVALDVSHSRRLFAGEIDRFTIEKRYIRKDGTPVWVNMTTSLLQTSADAPMYSISIVEDITEDKQMEEALAQERNRLRTIIDLLPDYIYVKDRQSKFVLFNAATMRLLNVTQAEDYIGKGDFDFYPPEYAERYISDERALMEADRPLLNKEEPVPDHNGLERWLLTTKIPLHDQDGRVIGLVGVGRDITERKRTETQQVELAVEKERVQMLQHFIRDTSHDLRTPLTTIKTSLYLLERTINDPIKRERYFTVINDQAGRLQQLLEDLLSLSRLDRTSIEDFTFEMRSLSLLLQNVVAGQRPLAERKHHTLTLSVEPDLPPILVDDTQLNRALSNMLTNALNYTPEDGRIEVRAFRRGDRLAVEIKDNGIGITEEDLPRIYDRFFRADRARNTETGGVGLGLTIARRIVEAHGGDIEVESTAGEGSTFRVWLPVVNNSVG